jgi:hypothetical protein
LISNNGCSWRGWPIRIRTRVNAREFTGSVPTEEVEPGRLLSLVGVISGTAVREVDGSLVLIVLVNLVDHLSTYVCSKNGAVVSKVVVTFLLHIDVL